MKTIAATLLFALLPATAYAQEAGPTPGPRSGERADIPFANTRHGIRTFTTDDRGYGVYIEDNHRNWYYASFFTRCNELPFAFGFGIKTFGGSSTLSRGDTIIAGGEDCRIQNIVRSGPPPEKPKKARRARKAA